MKKTVGLMLAGALLVSPVANAHEAGDIILRGGFANVSPQEDSDRINVAGLATLDGVTVDGNTQIGITATYMLSDSLGIEVLAATPFEHDIAIKNASVRAGSTKHLPPTVSLQYFFGSSGSAFRPYVGAGINTTIFFSEDVDPQLNAALDGIAGVAPGTVNASLELDQSWGLAVQAGFDYRLNDTWGVNAAIWYIDISTDATIKTPLPDVTFGVDVDPFVYMVGLSYKF